MQRCPHAKLVVHPRGASHMIQPKKLIDSVKQVYGEQQYREMYGDIIEIPRDRVIEAAELESIGLNGYPLVFHHSPGHAKHHMFVHAPQADVIFSGDAFGIGYPRFNYPKGRLVFPSTSPTQFQPDEMKNSINRIVELQPKKVLLTHFGEILEIEKTAEQLCNWIDFSVEIGEKYYQQDLEGDALHKALEAELWEAYEKAVLEHGGSSFTEEERRFLRVDADLNAQGIAHFIKKKYSL